MGTDEAVKYIVNNKKYFSYEKADLLISKLIESENLSIEILYALKLINPLKVFTVSILLGVFGVDRLLIGDYFIGFLKLVTFGGLGFLTVFDWFYITKRVKKINYSRILGLCYYYRHIF